MVVSDNVDSIMNRLEKVLNTKTLIGEPMEIAGVTIVPVMNVTFGFGAGGGEGKQKEQSGGGGGGGGGARMSVVAVIVVKDGDVEVMPLGKSGTVERLLEALPELLTKVKASKGKDGKGQEAADQEERPTEPGAKADPSGHQHGGGA